jgi:hypothetical protein
MSQESISQLALVSMGWVGLITLFVVLGGGYACLLSCRRILRFTTDGSGALEEAGFRQAVSTSRLSTPQRLWVAHERWSASHGMDVCLRIPAVPSPGLRIVRKPKKHSRGARRQFDIDQSDY